MKENGACTDLFGGQDLNYSNVKNELYVVWLPRTGSS